MSQKWIKKSFETRILGLDYLSTSDLSLVLSKKEEEWFFITSTLDGKMLHKLFFMRNATFENVTALLIQEHIPIEF